jgi:amino acid transporter
MKRWHGMSGNCSTRRLLGQASHPWVPCARLTQESARFNTIITMINLAVVVFVVCAGMPYAAGSNFDPFAPFGVHGIFSAASVVFFSFIGFDVIATTAEEVSTGHP